MECLELKDENGRQVQLYARDMLSERTSFEAEVAM